MDRRHRELERSASAGDVEAEAKLLLERVRLGELTEERLRLAAYLEHSAAVLALGDSAPEVPTDLLAFGIGLGPLGREVAARAALAACVWARRLHWEEGQALSLGSDAPEDKGLFDECLGAAEAWILSQGETEAQRAARAAEAVRRSGRSSDFLNIARKTALTAAGFDLFFPEGKGFQAGALMSVQHALGADPRPVVRASLLPWALGTGDPVRDRVEARQREAAE